MTTATEVALVLVFFIAAVVNGVTGPGIAILSLFFGGFTLWYVATELRREVADVPRRLPAPVAAAIGAVAGVTNGVVGASGPILGSYLSGLGLQPREFNFAISSLFFAMGVLRIGFLLVLRQYDMPTLVLSGVLVVSTLLGQAVGFLLHRRLSTETFRRAVLYVLLVAGPALLVRGIAAVLSR